MKNTYVQPVADSLVIRLERRILDGTIANWGGDNEAGGGFNENDDYIFDL